MKKLSLVLAIVVTFCSMAVAQNASVYTSTKTCRTLESHPDEAGWYRGRCPGVGGYQLDLTEGDLRQSLDVITPSKKKLELNFTSFYGNFSAIGEKVEWRVKRGVPFALIARYNVADPEGGKNSHSYLIVSKIGPKESCVVDVIDPGPKQNEKARESADAAATKPCKTND
ncbi:MAG: hypothetical protein JO314_09550 [Acidobacteria bacterium]|nr:hypothetical protein [Acidobacteriota bacterium]